jgi:hypothetical protein
MVGKLTAQKAVASTSIKGAFQRGFGGNMARQPNSKGVAEKSRMKSRPETDFPRAFPAARS